MVNRKINSSSVRLTNHTNLKYNLKPQTRSFSIYSKNRNQGEFVSDPEFSLKHPAHHKAKAVQAFKKIYKGGFLVIIKVNLFGIIFNLINFLIFNDLVSFVLILKEFLNELPEN